jgi:hypothetical protein
VATPEPVLWFPKHYFCTPKTQIMGFIPKLSDSVVWVGGQDFALLIFQVLLMFWLGADFFFL